MTDQNQRRRITEGSTISLVLLVLLSIACIIPVFANAYVPLVDLPSHSAQVALWKAYASHPELQARYTLQVRAPYVGFFFLWRGLMALGLSLETAGRVLMSACLAGVPIGLMSLLAVRGRPWGWAILAFPLVYSWSFAWGFLPFCLATAFFFPALAMFAAWLKSARWTSGLGALVLGLMVLWLHSLVLGFWALCCGLLALTERSPSRPAWPWRLAPVLPPVGMLALWTLMRTPANAPVRFAGTLIQRAGSFFNFVAGGTTSLTTHVAEVIPALVVVILLLALRSSLRATATWRGAWDGGLLLTAFAAAALYLFAPFEMLQGEMVNVRFASFGLLLLIGALPAFSSERLTILATAVAAVTALLVDVSVMQAWRGFNEDVGDAHALFAALPPGTSAARPEGTARELPPLEMRVLDNFAGWHQAYGLGEVKGSTRLAQMLVRDRMPSSEQPQASLVRQGDDVLVVLAPGEHPDVLIFYSAQPPPETMSVVGGGHYRLTKRTGGMNAFVRE